MSSGLEILCPQKHWENHMKKPITKAMLEAMMCAFDEASDGLLLWEFGGSESQEEYDLHKEAAEEVSKRIKKMGERFYNRHFDEAMSRG